MNKAKPYSTYSVHNPNFAADEDAISYGVEAMVGLVTRYLNSNAEFHLEVRNR